MRPRFTEHAITKPNRRTRRNKKVSIKLDPRIDTEKKSLNICARMKPNPGPTITQGPKAAQIDLKEVLHMTQLSKPTLYRFTAAGKFPRPAKGGRGRRKALWDRAAVETWMKARPASPYWHGHDRIGRPPADMVDPSRARRFST